MTKESDQLALLFSHSNHRLEISLDSAWSRGRAARVPGPSWRQRRGWTSWWRWDGKEGRPFPASRWCDYSQQVASLSDKIIFHIFSSTQRWLSVSIAGSNQATELLISIDFERKNNWEWEHCRRCPEVRKWWETAASCRRREDLVTRSEANLQPAESTSSRRNDKDAAGGSDPHGHAGARQECFSFSEKGVSAASQISGNKKLMSSENAQGFLSCKRYSAKKIPPLSTYLLRPHTAIVFHLHWQLELHHLLRYEMELNQVWEDFFFWQIWTVMEASIYIWILAETSEVCFSKITWNQVQVFPTQSPEGFYQQFGAVPACNCKTKK